MARYEANGQRLAPPLGRRNAMLERGGILSPKGERGRDGCEHHEYGRETDP